MRWTVMRGSPVMRLESGVPSRPTRSTSTPFDTSASAWYCMRALRPRSPSATTAALIRERVSRGGAGILCRFPEAALDQPHDAGFVLAERRPGAGQSRGASAGRGQCHAVHVGIDDCRMNVALTAHGLRVSESFGDLLDRLQDVPLRF